jgi:acylpyruvate hydrolase
VRLATASIDGATRACRVEGGDLVLLAEADVGGLLAHPDWRERAAVDGLRVAADAVRLLPVVPRPDKIVCLGLNYASHIAEMGRERPRFPTLFAKYRASLIGPTDPIQLPRVSQQVDWEAELGVVIGRPGRNIGAADALGYVAGYCIVNDITVRDWQHRTREFLSGKTFEGTTPVGPALVTDDELPPGARGLRLSCEVDGQVMQSAVTDDLCFDVAAIVSYVSTIITLLPGDLIATGTPGGVGAGRDPQMFLRHGQIVRTSIEGIGELVNRCVVAEGGCTP